MAKRKRETPVATGSRSACQVMAHDLQRLAATIVEVTEGFSRNDSAYGPIGRQHIIQVRPGGPRGTFERRVVNIETDKLISDWSSVGNVYGLGRQMSRDIARMWGCKTLAPERGFEGAARRRR